MNHILNQIRIYVRKPSFFFLVVLFSLSCFLSFGAVFEHLDATKQSSSLCLFWTVFEMSLVLIGFFVWYPEQQSGFHRMIRSESFSYLQYFFAKIFVVSLYLLGVLFFNALSWSFFFQMNPLDHLSFSFFLFLLSYCFLSSLMIVMLSAFLLSSHLRSLIFPLLFFPLRVAILLAVSEGSVLIWQGDSQQIFQLWFWLLISFLILFLIVFCLFNKIIYSFIS